MKELLSKTKLKAIDALTKQIAFVGQGDEKSAKRIGVVPKGLYLSFERTYKVISKKELKSIVENEKHMRSPFANSYVFYRTKALNDGSWLVKYHFIDVDKYPDVSDYKLLILWDDIAQFMLEKRSAESLILHTSFGRELALLTDGSIRFAELKAQGLKERLLLGANEKTHEEVQLSDAEVLEDISGYLLSFQWVGISGALNTDAWKRKQGVNWLNPQLAKVLGLVLGGAIVVESLFLLASRYYMDNVVDAAAEQRQQYSAMKKTYLGQLDTYTQLEDVVIAKSNAASIPEILFHFDNKADLRIDRLDYLGGEVRIGGLISNMDALMAYLSSHKNVKGLEFMSPITPDRSGKDRFSIKFELLNEQ